MNFDFNNNILTANNNMLIVMESDILFSQEDIDRIEKIESLTGVEKELAGDYMQQVFNSEILQRTDNNIHIMSQEQHDQLDQALWDKSYELNHMNTGAYWYTEQHVREESNKQYPNELTPLEANALAKEYGIDLKYDRPVKEGQVRYDITQQLKKKALTQEIADIRSLGADYHWWEEVGLALNGSYSWFDLGIFFIFLIFVLKKFFSKEK